MDVEENAKTDVWANATVVNMDVAQVVVVNVKAHVKKAVMADVRLDAPVVVLQDVMKLALAHV